jgi:hypothetical protein
MDINTILTMVKDFVPAGRKRDMVYEVHDNCVAICYPELDVFEDIDERLFIFPNLDHPDQLVIKNLNGFHYFDCCETRSMTERLHETLIHAFQNTLMTLIDNGYIDTVQCDRHNQIAKLDSECVALLTPWSGQIAPVFRATEMSRFSALFVSTINAINMALNEGKIDPLDSDDEEFRHTTETHVMEYMNTFTIIITTAISDDVEPIYSDDDVGMDQQ